MKKIIVSLLLSIFILSFAGMGVALAQDQKLNDCCKINQTFNFGTKPAPSTDPETYTKGDTVGAKDITCEIALGASTNKAWQVDNWGIICMLSTVYTVTNWIFFIMTILAVLMVVYGGLIYITAAGDPSKAGKGKTILVYAMIGLAIALIAKLIPSLVRFIVGM